MRERKETPKVLDEKPGSLAGRNAEEVLDLASRKAVKRPLGGGAALLERVPVTFVVRVTDCRDEHNAC